LSIKRWIFYIAVIVISFLAGHATAAKPKSVTSGNLAIPKYEAPQWEPIVQEQLARRDVQVAQEQARKSALEAARRAEAEKTAKALAAKQTAVIATQNKPQPVSTNAAKMYIYMHESGNNPLARNSTGCLGIGQACPGSKLLAVCPNLADYACQDAFFTRYMTARYKTWENAYSFWLANRWW
jgi:hypothetical protein